MVKVMSFARNNGKVLVHCHAGLGRTGTLICCFLVWKKKMQPATAIYFTRMKRPGSVQTAEQVAIIYKFAESLKPVTAGLGSFLSFDDYCCNQNKILHGFEGRIFKHVPKVNFCSNFLFFVSKIFRKQNLPGEFLKISKKFSIKIYGKSAQKLKIELQRANF